MSHVRNSHQIINIRTSTDAGELVIHYSHFKKKYAKFSTFFDQNVLYINSSKSTFFQFLLSLP